MNVEFTQVARSHGLRVTKARLIVFTALKNSRQPVSAAELVGLCDEIDPASVYRTITLFLQLDVISSVTRGWKRLYELSGQFAPHHHHMVCDRCAVTIEIRSEAIEGLIVHLAEQHHFQVKQHHFELTGLCQNCQTMQPELHA